MTASSCPTCRGTGASRPPVLSGHHVTPCPNPWHDGPGPAHDDAPIDAPELVTRAELERDAALEDLRQEQLRHQLAEREVADLRAEVDRLTAALPDDIDPAHVRPMLHLLGPARMVLDRAAVLLGEDGQGAEAADMAQRITDWIGHPTTEEPAWATLPCEHPVDVTTPEREPSNPLKSYACRACRPCQARMRAGYAPGLVNGAPVLGGAS